MREVHALEVRRQPHLLSEVGLDDLSVRADRLHKHNLDAGLARGALEHAPTPLLCRVRRVKYRQVAPAVHQPLQELFEHRRGKFLALLGGGLVLRREEVSAAPFVLRALRLLLSTRVIGLGLGFLRSCLGLHLLPAEGAHVEQPAPHSIPVEVVDETVRDVALPARRQPDKDHNELFPRNRRALLARPLVRRIRVLRGAHALQHLRPREFLEELRECDGPLAGHRGAGGLSVDGAPRRCPLEHGQRALAPATLQHPGSFLHP
mmetsp:Transcript_20766/g.50176  ORF Transcript_20766/g.50176 Transcript_20766/m.50176 type:complete len:262 (+) Transcript_20766:2279-3064(+)